MGLDTANAYATRYGFLQQWASMGGRMGNM